MTLTSDAIQLLRKVQQRIMAEPKQFQMKSIFSTQTNLDGIPIDHIPNCGTAACIGGHILAVHSGKTLREEAIENNHRQDHGAPLGIAIALLGYTQNPMYKTDSLFHVTYWPANERLAYGKAETLEERAQIACQRIDNWIQEQQNE